MRRLSLDPTILALAITILLTIGIGGVRSPEGIRGTGLTRERFWRNKLDAHCAYDTVLAGDSRVLCDLSPESLRQAFEGRILNFGFNYVGLTPEYLRAVQAKLDPLSLHKTIVLGITPRSLTPLNMRVSGYEAERARPIHEVLGQRYLSDADSFFRPITLSTLVRYLAGRGTINIDFFPDGWMALEVIPPDQQHDLAVYRRVFYNNQVSKDALCRVCEQVSYWRKAGIRVFAFRPPVSREIFEAEESTSGFNEEEFRTCFKVAGGTWLHIPHEDVIICDGSHITATDVPAYSRRLGIAIRALITNEK